MKIGFIVGSLRKDSYNRKMALVAQELFPEDVETEFVDITNVPLYNEDLDGEDVHEEYQRIRDEIKKYDGYIFFVPEYNRSLAPAAKNVIDIVSKDPEGNGFAKKPAAIFSATMGGYGAMSGNFALKQAFTFVDMIPLQQPEIYLSNIHESFDENGKMDDKTKDLVGQGVTAFVDFAKLINREG